MRRGRGKRRRRRRRRGEEEEKEVEVGEETNFGTKMVLIVYNFCRENKICTRLGNCEIASKRF